MSCFTSALDYFRQCVERLCGYTDSSRRVNHEDEQLLSHDVTTTTDPQRNSTSILQVLHSFIESIKEQVLLVMRHGLRQDEVDPTFVSKANRPWDPPLASRGRNQAASIVSVIGGFKIDYIISSPFLRCLQTSAEVLVSLGLDLDHLIIDGAFSEVYGPRTLTGFESKYSRTSLEEWMWNGAKMEDAIDAFIRNEPCFCGVNGSVTILDRPLPNRVESVEQACTRYSKEIDVIQRSFDVILIVLSLVYCRSVSRIECVDH